jgi:hypothetical protein
MSLISNFVGGCGWSFFVVGVRVSVAIRYVCVMSLLVGRLAEPAFFAHTPTDETTEQSESPCYIRKVTQ